MVCFVFVLLRSGALYCCDLAPAGTSPSPVLAWKYFSASPLNLRLEDVKVCIYV